MNYLVQRYSHAGTNAPPSTDRQTREKKENKQTNKNKKKGKERLTGVFLVICQN